MEEKKELSGIESGELCDTLFFQGNGSSQTQALKYVGNQKLLQQLARQCGVRDVITFHLLM
ncbi:Uncharacterised protein [Legionella sainthelensi]|nr:Uncharacterised protein [Legionella sainthelensi]